MTGIVGSGFGIYGYLPAVLMADEKVFLLERSRDKLSMRPELAKFEERILWADDEEAFLSGIDTLIISVPPRRQVEILNKSLSFPNIKNFIIEKPVAPEPDGAIGLLSTLKSLGKNYRIGYSFLYTSWYNSVLEHFKNKDGLLDLEIIWRFEAHHYKNDLKNWKRYNAEGGGVVRFYGIHFIAILANLDFEKVIDSELSGKSADDISYWKSISKNSQGDTCNLLIDADSDIECFEIRLTRQPGDSEIFSWSSKSPFDNQKGVPENLDARVSILNDLYTDLKENKIDYTEEYQSINQLWLLYEKGSSFTRKE